MKLIKELTLITVLNRSISETKGNEINLACGFDTRFGKRWKLRNIKIEVVILLSGMVSEWLMRNLELPS